MANEKKIEHATEKKVPGDNWTPPNPKEIEHAIEKNVPAYNWAPPNGAKLEDRQTQRLPLFENREERKKDDKFKNPNKLGKLNINDVRAFAGPKADFQHIHPTPDNSEALEKAVEHLRGALEREVEVDNKERKLVGELRSVDIEEILKEVFRKQEGEIMGCLKGQAKARPPSFQDAETFLRLELGFDVIVKKIYELCKNINDAIGNVNRSDAAKQEYVDYLKNLNNADPKGSQLSDKDDLGYGRALKWVFVDPVIKNGQIKAVTIVGEWVGGTHISSNGVALPDNPPH